jgi:hypothetical protein
MAPNGTNKGKGKGTTKSPASVMNQRVSLDRDCIPEFSIPHFRGLIGINIVYLIKVELAADLLHDIVFLDPVTTCYIS